MLLISTDWGPKRDSKSAGATGAISTASLREMQHLAAAQFRENRVRSYQFESFHTEGCFFAGTESLFLPADFNLMGPAACEHCKRLRSVDISQTKISEILGGTFAHCSQLQQLRVAKAVRRIGRDTLLKHTPPTFFFVDKRAFAGCIQLRTLIRAGSKATWRGTHAEHDAFESCKLAAKWIRLLLTTLTSVHILVPRSHTPAELTLLTLLPILSS